LSASRHQVKSPWYPLDRRLGRPQSRSGRCGAEKNSQPLPGLEPPPFIQPVAIPLSYPGSRNFNTSNTTRLANPEDQHLNLHCPDNLKLHTVYEELTNPTFLKMVLIDVAILIQTIKL
jgi:hypothetical protein